jgi:hypothetical protein
MALATMQALMLYDSLNACLYGDACPDKLPADPCSMANPGFPATCTTCINKALAPGGSCNAKYQACTADKP